MAGERQVLTLTDAIRIGREQNRALKIWAARRDAESARASETGAQRLPSLAAYGSYTRIEEGKFKLSTTNLPQPLSVGDVVVNNYVFRLCLRQPLFTGFRLSGASDAADAVAEAAELDLQSADADLTYNVTTAYWTLYQARLAEQFAKENASRLRAYRADTEQLMEAGLATRNDLMKVDVQLSNARVAEIDASNDVTIAQMNLNNTLGQSAETYVELASSPTTDVGDPEIVSSVERGDTAGLALLAYEQRADLRAATARVRAASAAATAERGAWWPQVELSANLLYNNPNARYQPITPEFLGTWDVGVSVAMDLWNWGATAHRVEQSEARLRQEQLRKEQLVDNLSIELRRSVLLLQRAREKIAATEQARTQAQEQLRTLTAQYHEGLATSTMLLDAETSLLQSELQHSAANVEYALASAALRRALGNMPPGQPTDE
jgi:outer membrane protein TolC